MLMYDLSELPQDSDEKIIKIEFDHHLGSDSAYCGDREYSLVTEASSSCELVGLLACKLWNRKDLMDHFQIDRIYSRNFILAVLTGIIGDSKMGKYLKSNREKWFYNLFSSMFDELLSKETYEGSSNLSSMQEVYREIFKLTSEEEKCYEYFMERRKGTDSVGSVILSEAESNHLVSSFDQETIVNIARTVADHLAEKSGFVSLVGYYDNPESSDFIQFRMRRSQDYTELDLRTVISELKIENGGGHEGAVGFRIEKDNVPDIYTYATKVIQETEKLIEAH
jgi:nanoRNase/pAp phosphatase (c-di-AMP/oligoRNAs hydrolase)